ncbi:DNA cytosine methyltransferase [Gimesia maris]|uniref:DNA cytosine methyltransferase n=1 Tax=Gimesia maris TaxID=122 RepID=UPI0032EE3AC8
MKPTVGSLFAGIGGIDLGLERAGFVTKWQVEINDYARKVLEQHFPDAERFRDVKQFPPKPDSAWLLHRWKERYGVDIIVGGDPCQENSNARQNTGLTQKSLGGEFIRIVDLLRPWGVLRENPAAVRKDAPWPWFRFRHALESIGYVAVPFRLRSCCFGKDHKRERLFLFAVRADSMCAGLEGDVVEEMARAGRRSGVRNTTGQDRRNPTPRICRAADGVSHWKHRLKGLGNAVDVDVSEFNGINLMRAIMQSKIRN